MIDNEEVLMYPGIGLIPWQREVSQVQESLVHVVLEHFAHVWVDLEVVDENLVHFLLT